MPAGKERLVQIRPLGPPPVLATSAKSAPAPPASAIPDVLDVCFPAPGEIARESLKLAGRGLKNLGLPALGVALGGPAGLALGIAASAAAKVAARAGLKQSLISVGLGAALGAAGLALGPLSAAVLAVAPALAGAIVGGLTAARQDAQVSIRPQAFAEEYLEKVNLAVAQAKPKDSPQVKAPAPGSSDKQYAEAVLKAFQLAATSLPAGAALALAGESARDLLSPTDLKRFDQALLRAVAKQGKVYDGQETLPGDVPLKKIRSSGPSPAFATNQMVLLDKAFAGRTDPVTRDLVVGHELSHVRHKDAAFKQGVKTLNEMLSLAVTPGNLALELVKVVLQGMMAQESKGMELRADREGYQYARSLGHSPEALKEAAAKLFSQGSSQAGMFDSHPAGPERIQALSAHK